MVKLVKQVNHNGKIHKILLLNQKGEIKIIYNIYTEDDFNRILSLLQNTTDSEVKVEIQKIAE